MKTNIISWNADSEAIAYYVYRASEEHGTYTQISTVTPPNITYSDTTGEDYYWYRISIVNIYGEGPMSDPVKAESDTASIGGFTYMISHTPGSNNVYIVPASGSHLDYNSEYAITVEDGLPSITGISPLQSDYTFEFTSTYYPVYTNPTYIRVELGPVIASIPDDTIYRMILKNTWLVNQKATAAGITVDLNNVSMDLFQWVVCKTELDAINAIIMGLIPKSGKKSLGDLTIEKSIDSKLLDTMRKDALDCLEKLNLGFYKGVDYAVPAIEDTTRTHPTMDDQWGRFPKPVPRTSSGGVMHSGPWDKGGSPFRPRWYR